MFLRLSSSLLKRPIIQTGVRIANNLAKKNISLVAGGVAFYAFLSVFPAIGGALLIWGFLTNGSDLTFLLGILDGTVPLPVYEIISQQMIRITQGAGVETPIGAIFSIALALWSASKAINALMMAMTSMYGAKVERGYLAQRTLSFVFTLAGIFFAGISLILIGAVPPILEALKLSAFAEAAILTLRWVIISAAFFIGASGYYLVCRRDPIRVRFKNRNQVIPGALTATLIWLISSFAFSFYLSEFDTYNKTFGSLGAVAALLMWFWISAIALLVGAEVNTDYMGKKDRDLAKLVPQTDLPSPEI